MTDVFQQLIHDNISHEDLAKLVSDMAIELRIDIPSRPEPVDMFLARMISMSKVAKLHADAIRAAQDAHTTLMRCRL